MDIGTKLRTVLVIATCLNTALLATDVAQFNNPTVNMVYKIVSITLNFIIVALATYFNNDYTETAAKYTEDMRQAKLEESYDDVDELGEDDDDDSEGTEE